MMLIQYARSILNKTNIYSSEVYSADTPTHNKITLIDNMLNKVDTIIVGGYMAFAFLEALGENIGGTSVEEDTVEIAKNISGKNIIIGDGYTDYEIKKFGYAEKFIQFSENINRPILNSIADYTAYNFNDVINYIKNYSYR